MNDADLASDITELAYSELEANAAFVHGTADDDVLYSIPPEVLVALAWIGTSVVLPIFVGTVQSAISERLKKRKEESELRALELQKGELERLKLEVEAALEKLKTAKAPSEETSLVARTSLAEVLRINGWPSELADSDADRIVLRIRDRLWTPNA